MIIIYVISIICIFISIYSGKRKASITNIITIKNQAFDICKHVILSLITSINITNTRIISTRFK